MAMTAENLAEKYGITRQEADEYALLSQQRWKEGKFKSSLLSNVSAFMNATLMS